MARQPPELGTVPLPGPWAERGACRSWPVEWWFPGGGVGSGYSGDRTNTEQRADARTATHICRDLCPVTEDCLDHALRYRELGIWGGTNDDERRALRGKPRRKKVA